MEKDKKKKTDIADLIEKGKAKGTLTVEEIMEALEDIDYLFP